MTQRLFEASWHQARAAVFNTASPTASIRVPLSEAVGKVLTSNIVALTDLPPFSASRVDGWAVAGQGPWEILDSINAGDVSTSQLTAGQCVHIATGAALPSGTTACLRDEWSSREGSTVTAAHELSHGQDIRPAGYEAHQDEVVVLNGTLITPGVLGVIAACGHDAVEVHRRLTVNVLIFGNELVTSGTSGDGKVRDSLGPQLPEWLSRLGMTCLSVIHIHDTLDAHVEALAQSTADVIVTSGGTAAGPVDFLHEAITERGGTFVVDAVKVRPGYHQLFAQIGSQYVIGLPGNPQSAIISLLTLAEPLVAAAKGQPFPTWGDISLAHDFDNPSDQSKMVLVKDGGQGAHAVEFLDSSMLRGFTEANGYCLIPPGGLKQGALAEYFPLP